MIEVAEYFWIVGVGFSKATITNNLMYYFLSDDSA
jgi:hypothetical protein